MITLTTPPQINSVLGGNAPVGYAKLVLSPITLDPSGDALQGTLKLYSTSTPAMPVISGTLRVTLSVPELIVEVQQLDFYRRVALSAGQVTSVRAIIRDAQNALESGLVSLGVISGTHAPGV